MVTVKKYLDEKYQSHYRIPSKIEDIPDNKYMVYVLANDDEAIVVGRGKKNRARIILDNQNKVTPNHFKALLVRLYVLYGKGKLEPYIILCKNLEEAKTIEKHLHQNIGGNTKHIPEEIKQELFKGLEDDSTTKLILEIALRSSFDGISDLYKWKRDGLLSEEVWSEVSNRFKI